MPIDTRLDGRPEEVHATARWLREQLAFEVNASASTLRSTRNDAATGWTGAAGSVFHDRMGNTAAKTVDLRSGIETTADGLTRYADHLATAQGHMAQAREFAASGSLRIDGQVILEPGTADQRQVNAYNLAQAEADKGRTAARFGDAVLKNVKDDLRQKHFLLAADVINGAVLGGATANRVKKLKDAAKATQAAVEGLVEEYKKAPGGSPQSKALNDAIYAKQMAAQRLDLKATNVARRIGSKIPVIGLGITAAGIGYDIANGKPVVKSLISGIGGAGVAVGIGMLVGSAVGPAGTVAGAVIGAAVGTGVSAVLDYVYDNREEIGQAIDSFNTEVAAAHAAAGKAIGDGVEKINDTVGAANQAAADAVSGAGKALNDGARKAWNAIF